MPSEQERKASEAIEQTLRTLQSAFRNRNAEALAQIYADDAD